MEEKYMCLECGQVFDDPKEYKEDLTPGGAFEGGTFMHEYYGCPNCGGAYRPAISCDVCGKYVLREKVETIDNYKLCLECCDQLEEVNDR